MQSVSSRIWTHVTVSISYDDNHYTTGNRYNAMRRNRCIFFLETLIRNRFNLLYQDDISSNLKNKKSKVTSERSSYIHFRKSHVFSDCRCSPQFPLLISYVLPWLIFRKDTALSSRFWIYWLYSLQRDINPLYSKMCLANDTKLHLMVRLLFWSPKECGVPLSLTLLTGPFWLEVIVPVSSIYGSNIFVWKSFVLDRNTWYHITKLFLLIVTWSYNCFLKISNISY